MGSVISNTTKIGRAILSWTSQLDVSRRDLAANITALENTADGADSNGNLLWAGADMLVLADAAAVAAYTGVVAGEMVYQTDTGQVWVWSGSAWTASAGATPQVYANAAALPAAGSAVGEIVYQADIDALRVWTAGLVWSLPAEQFINFQVRWVDGGYVGVETANGAFDKPFGTIAAAIAAIVDETVNKQYIVMIMPGVYAENLVVPEFIHLAGAGGTPSETVINIATGALVTWGDAGASNLANLMLSQTGLVGTENLIDCNDGAHVITNCKFSATPNLIEVNAIDVGGGVCQFKDCEFVYAGTGDVAGNANEHRMIYVSGAATCEVRHCKADLSIADLTDQLTFYTELDNVAIVTKIMGVEALFTTAFDVTATGLAHFYLGPATYGYKSISGCNVVMTDVTGLGDAIFADVDGTGVGELFITGCNWTVNTFAVSTFQIAGVNGTIHSVGSMTNATVMSAGGGANYFEHGLNSQTLFVDADHISVETPDGSFEKPFLTIAAGIAAAVALTPALGNQYVVSIMPGVYAENLVVPEYVHLAGAGDIPSSVLIEIATGTLLTYGDAGPSHVRNLTLQQVPTTNAPRLVESSLGYHSFDDVAFSTAPAATEVTGIETTGGSYLFSNCLFNYAGTGVVAGNANPHIMIEALTAGLINIQSCKANLTIADPTDQLTFLSEDGAAVVDVHMNGIEAEFLTVFDGTATGVATFYAGHGTSGVKSLIGCNVHMNDATGLGDARFAYVDAAAPSVLFISGCHWHVDTFAASTFQEAAAGDTIISAGCMTNATLLEAGAGANDYSITDEAGAFSTTGNIGSATTVTAGTTFVCVAAPGLTGWWDDAVANYRISCTGGIITTIANSSGAGHS